MTATTRTAEIPAELKPADGRFGCGPSKVRPEALASARRAGRPDGDLAPPGAGPRPGRLGARRASPSCSSLPDGYEVVLGNGGTTAFWDAAAAWLVRERALHLTYGEFSQKFAKATAAAPVPRGADPGRGRARRRARAGRRPRRRRDRLGAQRDLDRRDGRRRAAPQDAGESLVLIDATSGAGGLPARPRRGRRLLLRPAEGVRRRRRPLAGAAQPGRDRPRRGARRRRRALAARLPLAADGDRELAQGADLQHARARDPAAARRPDRVDARPTAGSSGASARSTASSGRLYGWAEAARVRDPVRRRPGQALAGRRHDRLRRGRRRRGAGRRPARQRDRRRRALPQARPQPAADRDVPGRRPRRRRGAHRLHRLGDRERRRGRRA